MGLMLTSSFIKTKVRKNKNLLLFPLPSLFLLSSCSILKNAGIEKRKYRPGFFIESTSRNAMPAKELAVIKITEPISEEIKNTASADIKADSKIQPAAAKIFQPIAKKRGQ